MVGFVIDSDMTDKTMLVVRVEVRIVAVMGTRPTGTRLLIWQQRRT